MRSRLWTAGRVQEHPVVGATGAPAATRQVLVADHRDGQRPSPMSPRPDRSSAARTTGSRRVTCPTRSVSRAAAAASTSAAALLDRDADRLLDEEWRPAATAARPTETWLPGGVATTTASTSRGRATARRRRATALRGPAAASAAAARSASASRTATRRRPGTARTRCASRRPKPAGPDEADADHRSRAERRSRSVGPLVGGRRLEAGDHRPVESGLDDPVAHARQDSGSGGPGDRRIDRQFAAGGGDPAQLRQVRVELVVAAGRADGALGRRPTSVRPRRTECRAEPSP